MCDTPTLEDDVELPGYGEKCVHSSCMRYVQWPDNHERGMACSADDAGCVIDEVGEPPHRITVRAFRGGVGDLSDGIEFACADRDTKQDWVQLLLCACASP